MMIEKSCFQPPCPSLDEMTTRIEATSALDQLTARGYRAYMAAGGYTTYTPYEDLDPILKKRLHAMVRSVLADVRSTVTDVADEG